MSRPPFLLVTVSVFDDRARACYSSWDGEHWGETMIDDARPIFWQWLAQILPDDMPMSISVVDRRTPQV